MRELKPKDAPVMQEEDFYLSEMEKSRRLLPIFGLREKLLETIRDHQIVVLVGETGCGKTT